MHNNLSSPHHTPTPLSTQQNSGLVSQPWAVIMEEPPPLHEPWYSATDENRTAKVVVPTLIFFIYALMAVVAKNTLRFNWTTVKAHDVLLIIAMVLLLVETICVVLSCNHGLGLHASRLAAEQLSRFDKVRVDTESFLFSFFIPCQHF